MKKFFKSNWKIICFCAVFFGGLYFVPRCIKNDIQIIKADFTVLPSYVPETPKQEDSVFNQISDIQMGFIVSKLNAKNNHHLNKSSIVKDYLNNKDCYQYLDSGYKYRNVDSVFVANHIE